MLLTLFKFTTLLIPITGFGLGIFSLYKNPKSKTVILWFLFSAAVGQWGLFHYFHINATDANGAYFYGTLLHLGAILIPIFLYHFVLHFLYIPIKKTMLIIGYAMALILIILTFTTKLIVSGASPKVGFPFWYDAGTLFNVFTLYFWLFISFSIYLIIREYRKSDGFRRRQLFFILLGLIIGFISGGTNFLPHTLGIYPFGSFITFLYPVFIFYGVFMDEFKIKIRF